MSYIDVIIALVALAVGYFGHHFYLSKLSKNAGRKGFLVVEKAKKESKELVYEARQEILKEQEEFRREERDKRNQIKKQEDRLINKEETLDKKLDAAEKKYSDLQEKGEKLKKERESLHEVVEKQESELERVASLSKEEAKQELMDMLEKEHSVDLVKHIEAMEKEVKGKAKEKAMQVMAGVMQKYAAETASESTATIVELPSDDMKGRIIGREGRNINTFEHIAGVDVIVDDTPQTVLISGFDLIRRYIAKIALERLVADGRIHPARIEETINKVKDEVEVMIKELGEKAAFKTGVVGLPPEILRLLGRLKFRVTGGQNVLKRSIEVSFLAGQLAAELGANINLCKKGALLHAIGKAVDHEIVGHYAQIGSDIAKKFALGPKVIEAIKCHEGDPDAKSLEAIIVNIAYLIAANRPGANVDNLDSYIKRMDELENIAKSFSGVEESYALHTGGLVKVIIDPEELTDLDAIKLSHDIARKIETDLNYQGLVKVEVLREKRVEAIAD